MTERSNAPHAALGTQDLLARLVGIDSRNPVLAPDAPGEAAIAETVLEFLLDAGLDVAREYAAPGRPSVIGRLPGSGGGRALLLNAHMDTVGFGGMADPLDARVENGRLYGRGAYDMKAGLVAALAATAALAQGPSLRGDLIVMAVADEEHASLGTESALQRLRDEGMWAEGAIVTEPTDLQICVAHKGFAWATIATEGRAAHGSRRVDGVDAIFEMGRVLTELEALDRALQERPAHPLLGHASLHASLIAGGTELSTYPAQCELQLERRTLPGETPESVAAELAAIVERLRAADPQFRVEFTVDLYRPPLETPPDAPIVAALMAGVEQVVGPPPPFVGATFWMDAALLGAAGIPTVAFGPKGAGLHGDVEWADLASVEACAAVLVATARAFCG